MTKLRRRSTVSATTIRSPGSDSRNMKCGPGPRRLAPRNWTACKRTCQLPPPPPDGAHVSARAPSPVYCGGKEPVFLAAVAFSAASSPPISSGAPSCLADRVRRRRCWSCVLYRRSPSLAFPLALLSLVPLGALYLQVSDAAQVTPPESGGLRHRRRHGRGDGARHARGHRARQSVRRQAGVGRCRNRRACNR